MASLNDHERALLHRNRIDVRELPPLARVLRLQRREDEQRVARLGRRHHDAHIINGQLCNTTIYYVCLVPGFGNGLNHRTHGKTDLLSLVSHRLGAPMSSLDPAIAPWDPSIARMLPARPPPRETIADIVPAFPCDVKWRSRMGMLYILQFSKSLDSGCQRFRGRCYVQVPKTGSSAVKSLFGLPIVGSTRPTPSIARNGSVTWKVSFCAQTLVTLREPMARFISGIQTIHKRTARWCHQFVNESAIAGLDKASCQRLQTADEWMRYADLIIDEVSEILRDCTRMQEAGPQNLAPEFFHILPQWIFLRLIPKGSKVDLREVGDVHPGCVAEPRQVMSNSGEGSRLSVRMEPANLSVSLRARVEAFYRVDLDLWTTFRSGARLNMASNVSAGYDVMA